MAIDMLNAKGVAIGGKKVKFELVAEDDASDPTQASAAAQKLVDSKVKGAIGNLQSGTSIAASGVYRAAGIPQISPSATNSKYTRQGYKTAFRIIADDAYLGDMLGRYAVQGLQGRSIAIIDDRTSYGQGIADEFEKGVNRAGGRVVGREFTYDKATDFSAILSSLRMRRPDIIFFGGSVDVAKPMLRQLTQLGIGAKFMGGGGTCTRELLDLAAGTTRDGEVVCAQAGKVDRQGFAPYAYDAVNVMVAAMIKAGSSDPITYLPVLAKTEGYRGLTGTISFDDKGDIKNGVLTLFTNKGHALEPLPGVGGVASDCASDEVKCVVNNREVCMRECPKK